MAPNGTQRRRYLQWTVSMMTTTTTWNGGARGMYMLRAYGMFFSSNFSSDIFYLFRLPPPWHRMVPNNDEWGAAASWKKTYKSKSVIQWTINEYIFFGMFFFLFLFFLLYYWLFMYRHSTSAQLWKQNKERTSRQSTCNLPPFWYCSHNIHHCSASHEIAHRLQTQSLIAMIWRLRKK